MKHGNSTCDRAEKDGLFIVNLNNWLCLFLKMKLNPHFTLYTKINCRLTFERQQYKTLRRNVEESLQNLKLGRSSSVRLLNSNLKWKTLIHFITLKFKTSVHPHAPKRKQRPTTTWDKIFVTYLNKRNLYQEYTHPKKHVIFKKQRTALFLLHLLRGRRPFSAIRPQTFQKTWTSLCKDHSYCEGTQRYLVG